MFRSRLHRMAAVAALVMAVPIPLSPATAAPAWTLRWSPDAGAQSPSQAFEGLEDDRRDSHPEGQPHIYSTGSAYRFDMHTVDRDGSDRQRNESKGMRTQSGSTLQILEGETWRITYDMYVPSSLTGSSRFQHIAQMKIPGSGPPIYTMSVPNGRLNVRHWNWYPSCCETTEVGSVDLSRVHNRWLTTEFEFRAARNGYLRWVLRDGSTTLVDDRLDNVDMWPEDGAYLRPKWGIYRGLTDSLRDTYHLIRNLRAYEQTGNGGGGGSYEAESGALSGTARTSTSGCSACSGGAKVGWIGGGSDNHVTINGVTAASSGNHQLTIHGLVSGTRSFFVSVDGGAAREVPMTGSSWTDPTSTTISVPLNSGSNGIRFFNNGAMAPDLDRITIN